MSLAQLKEARDFATTTYDTLTRWRDHVEAALEKGIGLYNFDDVVLLVGNGTFKLVEWPGCFFIYQIQKFPQKTVFHVFIAGGELDAVVEAVPRLQTMAAHEGATVVTMQGRKGWERAFKDIGARVSQVIMEVDANG